MKILLYMRNYFKYLPDVIHRLKQFLKQNSILFRFICSMLGVACTKQTDRCLPAGAQSVATAATTKINGAIQVHEE